MSAPDALPLVVLDRMTRRYGEVVAASEVSFEVRSGEMFGLIGPDGAGKTTTLRVILGLLRPDQGTVRTCGLDPIRDREALSRRIGYLSQRFSLYGDLSVDENVAFFAAIHGVRGWKPRRDELLDLLRMTPFRTRLADRLSGGMKQKLALACTLIHTPDLLILDEPTTGVDPVSRRDFWRILARLQRQGLTLLLTTPYLDEAERCQRVALMDRSRILNLSTPDHLRSEAKGMVLELLAEPKRHAAQVLGGLAEVGEIESFGERLHAMLPGIVAQEATGVVSRISAALTREGIIVRQARAVPPTLEDLFIARMRAEEASHSPEVPPMSLPACLTLVLLATNPRIGADQDGTAPVARLTLAEALDRARTHSARLAQYAALETAAKAGTQEARAGRLPQLDLSAGYTRLSSVPELTLIVPGPPPIRQTVFPDIQNTYRAHAGLTQSLYSGGRIGAGVEAADHRSVAAGRDFQTVVQDLVLETTSAYWSLLSARETAQVLTQSLASFEAHLKDAQNRLDVGMSARSEVLAVQVERDRAELGRLQAENNLAIANEELIRLVGLPAGTRVDPADEAVAVQAAADEPDALASSALASRPDLVALRARVDAARATVRVARAPALPQVALAAGYDYARPNTRILPLVDDWKDSWSLGVNVSITAFDGGRTKAVTAQAQAQADALRHQVEDLERRVRVEVKSRLLDLATAIAGLAVADRALEAAHEGERVERDRYLEGVSASSDLLDAETRRLRAAVDRTSAATSVRLARARLDRAVGR